MFEFELEVLWLPKEDGGGSSSRVVQPPSTGGAPIYIQLVFMEDHMERAGLDHHFNELEPELKTIPTTVPTRNLIVVDAFLLKALKKEAAEVAQRAQGTTAGKSGSAFTQDIYRPGVWHASADWRPIFQLWNSSDEAGGQQAPYPSTLRVLFWGSIIECNYQTSELTYRSVPTGPPTSRRRTMTTWFSYPRSLIWTSLGYGEIGHILDVGKSRKVPYTQKLQAMAQETVHRKLASSLQSTLFKFTGARHTMLTALLSTEHLPTSLRTLREAWKSTTKVVHTTEYAHNLRDDMHRQPSTPTWCTVAGPCLSRKKSTPGTGIHNSEACASGAWRPGRVFVHGKCSAPEFSLTPHAPMVHGGRAVSLAQKDGARRRGHVRCALQRLSWALLLMDHAPMVHGGGGTSVCHYTEHQGLPLSMRQWCTATRPSPHVVQTGRFCSLCIPQWCTTAGCTTAGCTTAEHALAHIGCLCPLRRTVARCAPVVHGSGPDPLRSGSAHTAFPRPVCTIGAQPSAMCPQLAEAVSGPPANGACAGGALRRRHVFPLLYWTPGHSLSMRQWCTATWPCPHAVQSVRVCSLGMHQWCTTAEHAPPASVVYGAPWPGVRQWCTAVCASGARQWAEPVALWLGIH
ncbi:uncharacterized protein B0H18DRAFT_959276 [Fomitopsis serialis]|uniref:uncharacterized protein n=1 Tax=Fomitopsis serialis TaxID=139415 RepID=UPI0020083F68|nr:uncharacterized protein B0H18DRAFT_959276 [Neoantrodia serialis]KAH9915630.1 hypothetical protein B0H18DRAFT_959276 [Neoantrodia serialis]